jgi:hypothetical protein
MTSSSIEGVVKSTANSIVFDIVRYTEKGSNWRDRFLKDIETKVPLFLYTDSRK